MVLETSNFELRSEEQLFNKPQAPASGRDERRLNDAFLHERPITHLFTSPAPASLCPTNPLLPPLLTLISISDSIGVECNLFTLPGMQTLPARESVSAADELIDQTDRIDSCEDSSIQMGLRMLPCDL